MIIGGKERPFKFCLNSLIEFSELEGKSIEDVLTNFDKLDFKQLLKLVYCSFKYGAKFDNQDVDFTQENVNDWIWDDMDKMGELRELIFKSMPQSKNLKAPQKKGR